MRARRKLYGVAINDANYAIEMKKAETLRDTNAMTAAGLSEKLLQYRALEVQAKMAENKAAVFVPYDAIGTSGLSNRIYSK